MLIVGKNYLCSVAPAGVVDRIDYMYMPWGFDGNRTGYLSKKFESDSSNEGCSPKKKWVNGKKWVDDHCKF